MLLDLWPVIDAEAVDVTLRRKGAGSYDDNGEWVGETLSDSLIRAAVQPATGRKLLDLPEGERSSAQYFFWTNAAVEMDDLVIHLGKTYRINHLWPRPEGGFNRGAMGLAS